MNNLLSNLKSDIPSSIVVFFVALPLCLGIALASGAPLFSGLIAGIVGGIIVGSLSGSKIGVSGPAAGLAAIVLTAIATLGSYENFLVAVVLGGIIQLLFGVLKAGVIGYYFPSSVIKGMLTGIGIIIILKQIPHFFGYDANPEGDFAFFQVDGENTFSDIINAINHIQLGSALIGIIGLAGIIVNSGIVLISFIDEMRAEGKLSLNEILVKASGMRLRAVLVTSLTTVSGLLPTAYGVGGSDPTLVPMTLAMAWGLVSGTILTLSFIPPAYAILEDFVGLMNRIIKRDKKIDTSIDITEEPA